MSVRTAAIWIAVFLAVCSAGWAQPAEADVPRSLDALRAAFDRALAGGNVPGAQVVIIEGGAITLSYTYGVADVAAELPVTEATLFRAGSISKSLVATAVLQAVEEGLLDLATPVRELVPDVQFDNPWAATDPVRVVHLLEHTAGFFDVGLPEFLSSDPDSTIEEGLALGPHQRVSRWPPGERSAYSNAGPPIAALALERVSGKSFEELVDRRVFGPLGMSTSDFRISEPVERRLATSYRDDGVSPVPHTHVIMRPSGGLNTTALELARFVLMLLRRGELDGARVLQPQSVARMERAESLRAASEFGLDTAYGLGNAPIYSEKLVFRGHDGGVDGFSATYAYHPRLGVGAVLLVNGGEDDAFLRAVELALGYLTRDYQPELQETSRSSDELAALTGGYVAVAPRSRFLALIEAFASPLKVEYSPDRGLVVGGVPRIPVSPHGFRRPERAEMSFVVMPGDRGAPEIHYSDSSFRRVSRPRALASSILPLALLLGVLMTLGYDLPPLVATGVRRLRGRAAAPRSAGAVRARTLALLAAGTFLVAMLAFGIKAAGPLDRLDPLVGVTPMSAMLFVLTGASPLLALLAIGAACVDRESGWLGRSYRLVALTLLLAGQMWIAAFGWIPLRTWVL